MARTAFIPALAERKHDFRSLKKGEEVKLHSFVNQRQGLLTTLKGHSLHGTEQLYCVRNILDTMKRILLILLISVSAISSFGQKTGHINTLELIDKMPEKKAIEEELTNFTYETDALLKELIEKYSTLAQEIQDFGESWTPIILEMKKNELSRVQQTIQEAEYMAKAEFAMKEQELLDPLLEKAMGAIEVVADKRGYDYVIDTAAGSFLISPEEHDLMQDVLAELGL